MNPNVIRMPFIASIPSFCDPWLNNCDEWDSPFSPRRALIIFPYHSSSYSKPSQSMFTTGCIYASNELFFFFFELGCVCLSHKDAVYSISTRLASAASAGWASCICYIYNSIYASCMPCSARVVFGEKPRRTARAKKIIAIHHVCANQPLVPLLQIVIWPLSRSSSSNNNEMWEKWKEKE